MKAKKASGRKNKELNESEEDPEESEEEDPMVYLDLVKSALFESRRILEDIDEHG